MTERASFDEAVRQVRENIASGRRTEQSYRDNLTRIEHVLWEMRVTGSFDMLRAMEYETVANALRAALNMPPFPEAVTSEAPNAQLVQALEHGYDPDRYKRATPEREYMVCRRCGQDGYTRGYPFSTNPSSGLCDDCV